MLDDRESDLPQLLRYFRPFDVHVTSSRLPSGDACWEGFGPDSGNWLVGVERKKIRDLINSMRTRRLSGSQIPEMWKTYDRSYLLVEGIWRPGSTGMIEINASSGWQTLTLQSSAVSYREVDSYLQSMASPELGGMIVYRTSTTAETAAWLVSRYKWWQKAWDKHTAHKQIYAPEPEVKKLGWRAVREEPSMVWKMAAQLPGIDQKAELVAKAFKTPLEMCQAGEDRWRKIKGIGPLIAKAAVAALQQPSTNHS